MQNSVKALSVDSLQGSADVPELRDRPPPTAEEQTAIATILSDMDAEIAALETKLAKARQSSRA